MLDELNAAGDIPIAGTGMIRTLDNTLTDARWTLPGFGWYKQHKTFAYNVRNGANPNLIPNRPGDRLTFDYYDGGPTEAGTFTVTIGNNTPPIIITSSATPGWRKRTIEADIAAGTPITFTKTSGPYMAISEACVWDSAGGFLVHNVGQGGSTAHGAGTTHDRWTGDPTREGLPQVFADPRVTGAPADLLILSLGGNDARLASTYPELTTDAIVNRIRQRRLEHPNSDCILIGETQLADTLVPRARWEHFLAGLHDLAYELDVPYADQDATLGPYTTIRANGWNADNAGHLKPHVLEHLGRSLARALLAVA
jgi:hypothetical protein